jgi:Ca-activated chloride channel family protein
MQRFKEVAFWGGLAAVWLALGWSVFTFVIAPETDVISFEFMGRQGEILAPQFLMLLMGLPLIVLLQRWSLSDLPTYQQVMNSVLRVLVLTALVGALVQVVLTSFDSRISTIFVIDTSASVPDEVLTKAILEVNAAVSAKRPDDEVQVVAFADRPYAVPLSEAGTLVSIPRPTEQEQLVTDASSALRMAYGLFPQDHLKRIVLVSDGNQTRGDLLGEAIRARAFGIRVHNREIPFEARPEVLVRGLQFPDELKVGEPFTMIARVFTNHKVTVDLQLWQNDFKDGNQTVDLEPGVTEIPFKTEVYEAGFRTFKLDMKVNGEDHFPGNNSFVYSTNVRGKPRILYVEGEMRARLYLERALKNENFEVETRGPMGVPTTLDEFASYDLVLISDVPAMYISNAQMVLIDRYTKELGGGFIMAGGESSFGPGGYYGTYIEKVLPVDFDSEKKRDTPTLALMLLIDKSGSMSGDKIELAKDAAKAAVEILQKNDKIGVGAFDDGVMPLVRMQSASNRARILSDIGRLAPSGGTNIAGALQHGFENLAITPARVKHIILLTDGHSDTQNIFTEIIPALRLEDITVSTVAVGSGADTTTLRRIAEGGGGRYYYTNDPYNVPRIFMKETSMVSRSSMVEEPFRPRVVKRAQAIAGIDFATAPYLLGYVSTKLKPQAELILQSDYKEPILARWRNGLGKVVAFTSDLKNRWAVEWVRWPGYAKFWAQLIRDTMRANTKDQLAMTTSVDQGVARIIVDAIGEDDRFINDLVSKVQITPPSGKPMNVDLRQSAAGRYEARVPLKDFGSYGLQATHDRDGDTIAVSLGSVSYPYPQEFLFAEANPTLMRRAAEVGGGQTNPAVETLFDPMGEEVKYRRKLWPLFVVLSLLLLLLDLAMRRIRLSGATEIPWDKVSG